MVAGTLHKLSDVFGLANLCIELQSDTQTIQQGYKSQDNTASTFGLAKMSIAETNVLPSISKVVCEGVPTKESHVLI